MSILNIFSGWNKRDADGSENAFLRKKDRRSGDRPTIEKDNSSSLNSEAHFHRFFWREQKRSERSKKQLLVMTIGGKNSLGPKDDVPLLQQAVACVTECVRETDLSGWFETDVVFGVLFTELGGTRIDEAKNVIQTKVMACFRRSFGASELNRIVMSFHPFPEGWEWTVKKRAKHALDHCGNSDRSLVTWISSVPRNLRFSSHYSGRRRDHANPAFRQGQIGSVERRPTGD